jgi:hypothetical protein
MDELRAFRAAMTTLQELPADDIRLDMFWEEHDVRSQIGG